MRDDPAILADALRDARVQQALERALRDASLRRRFEVLRRAGMTAGAAVEVLAEAECLSEEHVRTFVYQKGRVPPRA